MGFGHLRIAHACASWLEGREAYVYDLLAAESPEAESLKRYEWAFDKLLTSGDATAQSRLRDVALRLKPLIDGI